LYLINLFGKASGSKLNKKKTPKCLWLGAWKDRKDNYKFGIDFVECIKIGNNIRQDDIWHPIYVKFEKSIKFMEIQTFVFIKKIHCFSIVKNMVYW
jgi:hypothetical protein